MQVLKQSAAENSHTGGLLTNVYNLHHKHLVIIVR